MRWRMRLINSRLLDMKCILKPFDLERAAIAHSRSNMCGYTGVW